jgi:hypothetical protein
MLGWHISVYRQDDGTRLAVWQTGLDGLRWLDELVTAGQAIDLGGDGYPRRYTAAAEVLVPRIIDHPPEARTTWVSGAGDILTSKWEGKTVIDAVAAAQCPPGESLLVEAWDES